MLVSNYQIYYIHVLELSLIWTDHPNTCNRDHLLNFLFTPFHYFIYLFIFSDEKPVSLVEVELGLGPILESET